MRNTEPAADGLYDDQPEECQVCAIRRVAGWPGAKEAAIPIKSIAAGVCEFCEVWLGLVVGVLNDGTLTINLLPAESLLDRSR